MEMENIGMVEAKLPPGFRFHPRDEELVCDYLMNKITLSDHSSLLIEVDLNKCEPWDIPREACVGGKEWYFYSQRDRKYATGLRTNRATASGYWKATGKDRPIFHFHNRNQLVGMRKTLVFYQGRAPKGRKTEWVMHEFRLEGPLSLFKDSSPKEDWVLCRLFCKQKEITTRPNTGNGCYNNTEITASSSSSLPPLMDSYINFDQNQSTLLNDQFQQVSCFSIISQNQTDPSLSNLVRIEPNNKNFTSVFEGIPYNNNNSSSHCSNIDPFVACDSKVLKVVLDNIAKMETNGNSFRGQISMGEGSSDSYLSEVGDDIAILWNR